MAFFAVELSNIRVGQTAKGPLSSFFFVYSALPPSSVCHSSGNTSPEGEFAFAQEDSIAENTLSSCAYGRGRHPFLDAEGGKRRDRRERKKKRKRWRRHARVEFPSSLSPLASQRSSANKGRAARSGCAESRFRQSRQESFSTGRGII